mgnify:CR=1 FL=1
MRALSKTSINQIYKNGHHLYTKSFTIKWLDSGNGCPEIRLLISVPKKSVKKAVDRNYIKRIIRESYKINRPFICKLFPHPVDIVLIYNKTTVSTFNKLKIELLTLFELVSKKQHEINQ